MAENPDLNLFSRAVGKDDILLRCLAAEEYLKEKKNEKWQDYEERLKSFQSWLCGDWDKQHIAIEEWAIKEFRKHRKRIKEILKYD